MPRSPNRHRSPSSRQKTHKRDYRHSNKDSSDRYYGSQTRKKIHQNQHYQNEHRQRSRKTYDDQNRLKTKQSYEQRPNITIVEKQPYNKPKKNLQESEIKVHFRFKPIKVKLEPQHQQEILKLLQNHVSKKKWPVEHFQKSADSRSGYLVIQFGFKYDQDAYSYLKDKFSEIDLTIEKEKHNITAEPTKIFKLLIEKMEEKKNKGTAKSRSASKQDKKTVIKQKQRQKKRSGKKRRNSSSRSASDSSSKSSSSSSSRSRRSSRRSKDRHKVKKHHDKNDIRDRDYDRKYGQRKQIKQNDSRKRSPQNNGNNRRQGQNSSKYGIIPPSTSSNKLREGLETSSQKKYKTLYFFGIHYSVNLKDMDNLFYMHEQGPFKHKEFIMRRMKNSICEYMEGIFEERDANKILQISQKLLVKGYPFIVIESQSGEAQKLLSKLCAFQINLQVSQKIEPYYILKWLKKCGTVIQIISLNKLTSQGLSEYFNITFNSRKVCNQLKDLRHKDICVEQVTVDNVINVFRPNFKTDLLPMDNKDREGNSDGKGTSDYQQNKDKLNNDRSGNKVRDYNNGGQY